jgi:hypothetical protein
MDYDVIVIGSGFGGAITSCRLAEKKKRVLVLERGKKWTKDTYPRELDDDWIWSHSHPEEFHGWTDLRRFKGMAVIAGAGVGGGFSSTPTSPPFLLNPSSSQAGPWKLPSRDCKVTTPRSRTFSTSKRSRTSNGVRACA